jgi:excisionase family DNA binding protein
MVVPDLLTPPEFAAALKVKLSTVRAWIFYRKVKSHRPGGGLVRIPASEVIRLLKESERPAVKGWEG